MKFRVIIEYDPEVKSYAVHCPELPGCASCGETEDDALNNIKEAIELYLEPSPQAYPGNVKEVFIEANVG